MAKKKRSSGRKKGIVQKPPNGRRSGIEIAKNVLGKSKVYFTRHALDRMEQRGITSGEVYEVLESPTQKNLPAGPAKLRWRKEVSKATAIDVVFVRTKESIKIITVIEIKVGRKGT